MCCTSRGNSLPPGGLFAAGAAGAAELLTFTECHVSHLWLKEPAACFASLQPQLQKGACLCLRLSGMYCASGWNNLLLHAHLLCSGLREKNEELV